MHTGTPETTLRGPSYCVWCVGVNGVGLNARQVAYVQRRSVSGGAGTPVRPPDAL